MMAVALPPVTPAHASAPPAGSHAGLPAEPDGECPPRDFARALDAAEAAQKSRAAPAADRPDDSGVRSARDAAHDAAQRVEPEMPMPAARPAAATKIVASRTTVAGATAEALARRGPVAAVDGGTPAASERPSGTADAQSEKAPTEPAPPTPPSDAAALLAELRALSTPGGTVREAHGAPAEAEHRSAATTPQLAGAPPAGDDRPAGVAFAGVGSSPVRQALEVAEAETQATTSPLAEVRSGLAGDPPAARIDASVTLLAPPLTGMPPATAATAAAGTTTAPSAEARLTAPPGSADFSSQLGAQLTTFVREGVQHARLHLHPAELGPVTVRIQIDGQAAQVHMAAEHALTRQALEQSMPMLAGSLREAGLTLSGGGVFEQPRQREGGAAPGQPGTGHSTGSERAADAPGRTATPAPARRGVVDLVA